MKLNKNGWGLVTELIFILLAVILLVYAIYGLNRFGLVRDMDDALGPLNRPDLIVSGKKSDYSTVESELIESTKEYVEDKYGNVIEEEYVIVRISHLVKNGYIGTIRDTENNKCTGYVKVTNNFDVINYNPYLKCSKYETTGYESEHDW